MFQVGDLTREESIKFLIQPDFFESGKERTGARPDICIDHPTAEAIYDLVGGRIQNLISCKREYLSGIPLEEITEKFREKEREKFLHLKKNGPYRKSPKNDHATVKE